ncbi:uncharacterized protein AB675_3151 [Cyphellophora attinorum]|uniref:Uncharacterized protein n=1 Tax=Cyphellophora attinorum TaxID=1664694 RepID=A0A0N0NKE1_9EURO|nr:uncharacterized protein AB675_3151 [Phialophora attinorum]KPI37928.1 hypothetical protein AB675_3151 [Phialophora attinorum]
MPRALLPQRSIDLDTPIKINAPARAQSVPLDILASVALSDAHDTPTRPQTPGSQIRQPLFSPNPGQDASSAALTPTVWRKGVMISQEHEQEPVIAFCPRSLPADHPPSPSPQGRTASINLSWRTTPYSGPLRPWQVPAIGRYRRWWNTHSDYPVDTTPCPAGRGVVVGCLRPHPDAPTASGNDAEYEHDPVACQRWHEAQLTKLEPDSPVSEPRSKISKTQLEREGPTPGTQSKTRNGKQIPAKKRKRERKGNDDAHSAPYSSSDTDDQPDQRIKRAMSIKNIVNGRSPQPENGSWLSKPRSQWAVMRRKWNARIDD